MFEVIAKIYNGNQLVKYEVIDMNTNRKKVMSVDMVQGLAIAGALVNAEFNERSKTITGINGHDLRTLPKKQEVIKKNSDIGANYIYGEKLLSFVNENTALYNKERYLVSDVMDLYNHQLFWQILMQRWGYTLLLQVQIHI